MLTLLLTSRHMHTDPITLDQLWKTTKAAATIVKDTSLTAANKGVPCLALACAKHKLPGYGSANLGEQFVHSYTAAALTHVAVENPFLNANGSLIMPSRDQLALSAVTIAADAFADRLWVLLKKSNPLEGSEIFKGIQAKYHRLESPRIKQILLNTTTIVRHLAVNALVKQYGPSIFAFVNQIRQTP